MKVRTRPIANAKRRRAPSPLRADPTRTATLRRRFEADLRRRFAALRAEIVRLVVDEDALGLRPQPTLNQRWRFRTTPEKVEEFKRWLQQQIRQAVHGQALSQRLLPPGSVTSGADPWAWYVEQGFKQGAGRAFDDTRRTAAVAAPSLPESRLSRRANEVQVEGVGTVRFVPHPNQRRDEVTVFVDPRRIDAAWERESPDRYIPPGGGGAEVRGRREDFENFLRRGEPVQAPRIVKAGRGIDFTDGRHRFSVLRDRGVTRVAVTVPKDQAAEIVEEYGVRKPERLDFYAGTKDDFLRSAFGRPVAVEKVKLLAGRTLDELEGVTSTMATRMSRALTDGLVQGKGPREVARDIVKEVDVSRNRALTIARTETIRAHSEGQLEALELLGVEEVGVSVEWIVTDDERLCPACAALEGVVLKLEEAKGMLPRHPNCRCSWVPSGVGESSAGQKATKGRIDRAISSSIKQGGENWAGVDKTISRRRPESILE